MHTHLFPLPAFPALGPPQIIQRHSVISRYNPNILPPPSSSDGASDASAATDGAPQLPLASLLSHPAHALLPGLSFYQQPASPNAPNRWGLAGSCGNALIVCVMQE